MKNLRIDMDKRILSLVGLSLLSLILIFVLNASVLILEWFAVMFVIAIISWALYATKFIEKREIYLTLLMFMIFSITYSFYFSPGLYVAKSQGTVLSDNWFNALNWIRNNTKDCAVIATYWDPGHFITGIAQRAVVFDGASQNALLIRNTSSDESGMVIKKYDNGINRIMMFSNGTVTTARIQDIAATLLTGNETLALDILKEYKKLGCDELYYIASSDLISKSVWWSYFTTWEPAEKGKKYYYLMLGLSQAKPIVAQNAIAYTYPMAEQQSFVLYEINGTIKPYLQQGSQFLSVEKIFYVTKDGMGAVKTYPDSEIKGLLWLTPDRQLLIYIPPELENSLFTKMYFFNGQGLENFEFVNNWGGEVKLFRVKFE
ncbi:MAG: hypothetical protein V1900_00910 [Candidatus Aenigmatarchaeota archaeon]